MRANFAPHPKFWSAAAIFLLLALAPQCHAQALPTASKTMDISAFGGYIFAKPDFGPDNNTGGAVGIDFTRYFGWRIAPSLEARGTYSTGDTITLKSLVGGLKFQTKVGRRYYPYADFLAGGGTISSPTSSKSALTAPPSTPTAAA